MGPFTGRLVKASSIHFEEQNNQSWEVRRLPCTVSRIDLESHHNSPPPLPTKHDLETQEPTFGKVGEYGPPIPHMAPPLLASDSKGGGYLKP